ncbi:MAG TPA: phosphatase PAP2 family protein [Terriglobales bacterium]|nr:phosphatase PAP2 family protein [Terriglobales bacterium]
MDDTNLKPDLEPLSKPTIFEEAVALASLAVAAVSLFFFAWIANSVSDARIQAFDLNVRNTVHTFASPAMTRIMLAISFLGGDGLVLAALLALLLFWHFRRGRAALWLVVTLAGALVLDVTLKLAFHRARPTPFFGLLPRTYSFPSGHALFSFCFYGVLAGLIAGRVRAIWLRAAIWSAAALFVFAIGLSRIYLGVHYPSDVIAGYLTASLWVATMIFLDRWRKRKKSNNVTRTAMVVLAGITLAFAGKPAWAQTPEQPVAVGAVHVDTNPKHILNSFDPDKALGSSLDVLSRTDIDKVHSPHIVQESLSAGWGPITYRNNTELRMGAWHWTENGTWSDPVRRSGYFTGSTELKEPTRYILAYALPHRGFATSGDSPVPTPSLSYWKSNPYLTTRFTHESDALHPQWVVVDLRVPKAVSAIRIDWQNPYAIAYQVEYWEGKDALDFDRGPDGAWHVFPAGLVTNAKGGMSTLKLSDAPVTSQFLRVLMSESSNTCDLHGSDDVRNCVGYAIQSIDAGNIDGSGEFVSLAKEANAAQPTYCASSIDPWHSAADVRDDGKYQHTGFDLFFTSGITNGLPAMIPVTMLYGTPEDAAAQIAYVEKRGYPIAYIEMGEEPDGKHAMPEDYAALYIQWADALHKVDPKLKLGGPIFEGVNEDIRVWPDAKGRMSWMGRFVDYLKSHGRLTDLSFVSFEHYPYEPCEIKWESLYVEPRLMKHILQVWRDDGVSKEVPLMVTESHLAAELTGPMSTIFSGLWLADSIGSFFEGGGAVYHHSPIQPQGRQSSCLGTASWSNFVSDRDYNISGYTALYFAAHMINNEWTQHRSGVHEMFPSSSDIKDEKGNVLVTSYTLRRPDGNWALMLVNRDENRSHSVRIVFETGRRREASFAGPVATVTFGSEQYIWREDGPNSHADPDGPPAASLVAADPETVFVLPKASITVVRGRVAGL